MTLEKNICFGVPYNLSQFVGLNNFHPVLGHFCVYVVNRLTEGYNLFTLYTRSRKDSVCKSVAVAWSLEYLFPTTQLGLECIFEVFSGASTSQVTDIRNE